jgi:hypothetical protein
MSWMQSNFCLTLKSWPSLLETEVLVLLCLGGDLLTETQPTPLSVDAWTMACIKSHNTTNHNLIMIVLILHSHYAATF